MKHKIELCHRYLIKGVIFKDLLECRVIEISKDHVKLAIKNHQDNDYFEWRSFEDVVVIEDLGLSSEPIEDLPF